MERKSLTSKANNLKWKSHFKRYQIQRQVCASLLANKMLVIGYEASSKKLFVDRSGCANNSFNKEFASLSRYETFLVPVSGKIKLHIFFDNSIIEVFANDGIAVMTTQIFPDENDNGIELFSEGGTTKFETVRSRKMRSAW
jgi:fructan beta-fructosidase